MGLKEQVEKDLVTSLKAKDVLSTKAIRMLLAALKNREIDQRGKLDDAECIKVVQSLVKQRLESAELFRQGNRAELAQAEEQEIVVLKRYLPEQISTQELQQLVDTAIAETHAETIKDLGKVMKALLPRIQGRADNKVVSELVRKKLP